MPVQKGKSNKLLRQAEKISLKGPGEMSDEWGRPSSAADEGRDEYGRTPDMNIFEEVSQDSTDGQLEGVKFNQFESLGAFFRMKNAPILGPDGRAVRQLPRSMRPAEPAPREEDR